MSENTEKQQCQICHGYLFEDDDVVVCPHCGAPHHRDCWNSVGHCGLEELHGTENQYNKVHAKKDENSESTGKICPHCGKPSGLGRDVSFCPHCGKPYQNGTHGTHGAQQIFMNGVPIAAIDPYGGVPKDSEIENVKIRDVAKFVVSGTQRYIPRFAALSREHKGSWNWAAFLFPSAWCFGRKMYTNGILFLILAVAASLCLVPMSNTIADISDTTRMTYTQMYRLVMDNLDKFSLLSILMAFAGTALALLPRIICGRLGDWFYRSFVLDSIKKIRADDNVEDYDEELGHRGSLNLGMIILALAAERLLPYIILTLI